MSQAGRYAHQQNKNRHNQGKPAGYGKVAETIETADWMSHNMGLCRLLSGQYSNSWSVAQFCENLKEVSPDEGERRLRYLSKLGFLRMSAYREDGKFVEYRFHMEDVNLPE